MGRRPEEIERALGEILDATAHAIEALEELEVFPLLDKHMDQHQERGYALVRQVKELTVMLPEARTRLEVAQREFEHAEEIESLNEEHVKRTVAALRALKDKLAQAIAVLERQPRLVNHE